MYDEVSWLLSSHIPPRDVVFLSASVKTQSLLEEWNGFKGQHVFWALWGQRSLNAKFMLEAFWLESKQKARGHIEGGASGTPCRPVCLQMKCADMRAPLALDWLHWYDSLIHSLSDCCWARRLLSGLWATQLMTDAVPDVFKMAKVRRKLWWQQTVTGEQFKINILYFYFQCLFNANGCSLDPTMLASWSVAYLGFF